MEPERYAKADRPQCGMRSSTLNRQWDGLGRPEWDRLGLAVLSDGLHRVRLDEPDALAGPRQLILLNEWLADHIGAADPR